MKKSSLLITAAASLVCLVSCNQPAKQSQKYDAKSVMVDICKNVLGIKNPKEGTDFSKSKDTYYVYDFVAEDPSSEDQLMDMCYAKFNAIKSAISYLDVNYEPKADEEGSYQAGFVTKNEETTVYVLTELYEEQYVWEIDVQPNPVQKGWVTAEFLKEKLDVEGVEVPSPTGEHTFEYVFRNASGTDPRYVWAQAAGENLEAAYKAQLTAANWTVKDDEEGGFSAVDPNQKVAMEVYGHDADTAKQQEAITNFFIFNYEEYIAEPAESPDNVQQVVLDVFNTFVEPAIEDPEEYWYDSISAYAININFGAQATMEQVAAYVAQSMPAYLIGGDFSENGDGDLVASWLSTSEEFRVICFVYMNGTNVVVQFQIKQLVA